MVHIIVGGKKRKKKKMSLGGGGGVLTLGCIFTWWLRSRSVGKAARLVGKQI